MVEAEGNRPLVEVVVARPVQVVVVARQVQEGEEALGEAEGPAKEVEVVAVDIKAAEEDLLTAVVDVALHLEEGAEWHQLWEVWTSYTSA